MLSWDIRERERANFLCFLLFCFRQTLGNRLSIIMPSASVELFGDDDGQRKRYERALKPCKNTCHAETIRDDKHLINQTV